MKGIICEICGGTELVKTDGMFVCQQCGAKYDIDEVKKMLSISNNTTQLEQSQPATDASQNYIELAYNAFNSSNNSEAIEFANKVLAINPKNPDAWLIKANATAWSSTTNDFKISESIDYWINAITNVEEERFLDFSDAISSEAIEVTKALYQLRAKHFGEYPSQSSHDLLESFIDDRGVLLQLMFLQIDGYFDRAIMLDTTSLSEYVADLMLKAAISGADTACSEFGTTPSEKNRYAYDLWTERFEYCRSLLADALILCNTEVTANEAYKNYKLLTELLIDSCSYTLDDYGYYVKDTYYSPQAKTNFTNQIANFKAELNKKLIDFEEEVSKKIQEYWDEHPEEKNTLEKEKEELNNSIEHTKFSMSNEIKEYKKLDDLRASLNEKTKAKVSLGMFKMKEKKELQQSIDSIESEIETLIETISNLEIPYLDKIHGYESRLEEIDTELTKPR